MGTGIIRRGMAHGAQRGQMPSCARSHLNGFFAPGDGPYGLARRPWTERSEVHGRRAAIRRGDFRIYSPKNITSEISNKTRQFDIRLQ